jgi:hypothetical protein
MMVRRDKFIADQIRPPYFTETTPPPRSSLVARADRGLVRLLAAATERISRTGKVTNDKRQTALPMVT